MEEHRIKVNDVLSIIEKKFIYAVDAIESTENVIVLRLPFSIKEEAEKFRLELSKTTSTEWTVYYENSKGPKCYFHKVWKCHMSSFRKASKSKRNAGCTAKLDIKIKNVTEDSIESDHYLKNEPPLRTVVTLSLTHNHSIRNATALQLLRVTDEVKDKYFAFFSDGVSPCDAISLHENELLCHEKYGEPKFPTARQVYYLYDLWRLKNLVSCDNPFIRLKEKLDLYEQKGATVKFIDGDLWAVLIVTHIMKRSQYLLSSKDIIFVDSSHACERTPSIVTVMLTACKVGAIPLAFLIHKNQTTKNYVKAFSLLKDNFPDCFGENDVPVFMTEDSTAKKEALRKVWPSSTQLLFHFHVAHALWRWFHTQDNISEIERPRLLKLFQAVMYADSEIILDEAVSAILKETKYPNFLRKFQMFYKRKSEWILSYRQSLLKENNNTINHAVESVRMVKDVILCKTKNYNILALVEFSIIIWQQYLTKKLLLFAYSKKSKPCLLYSSLYNQLCHYKISDVIEVEENVFLIQSPTDNSSYVVNANIGICSCYSGRKGALCQHQYFLEEHHRSILPRTLCMNSEEKYLLAVLALGKNCPPFECFAKLQEAQKESSMHLSCLLEQDNIEIKTFHKSAVDHTATLKTSNISQNATVAEKLTIMDEFCRISDLLRQDVPKEAIAHLTQTLRSIHTPSDLQKLTFFKSIHNKTKKNHVLRTSMSRKCKGFMQRNKRALSHKQAALSHKLIKRRIVKCKRYIRQNIHTLLNAN